MDKKDRAGGKNKKKARTKRIPVGARFCRPAPGAHPDSYVVDTGSFLGVKRPGREGNHPPSSSTEVKERVDLYLFSPFGPSWPVLLSALPLLLTTWRTLKCCSHTRYTYIQCMKEWRVIVDCGSLHFCKGNILVKYG
jgi:hypothetical protein